ncbi:helix-turn-helix domain-containing protein [Bosea sp. F3-2]|uniref:helix-turn-helix domain-containing protein n=1 Tax=Bosea sp. F3-2 TaxID=2599640 RepID=UPI0011EDC19C|nr:XRE family transcriptional regulator [Bosea sp. F3-2]QEL23793.1 helix-turn-helix domain-containing protein [Bosea sp. F3-2]
MSELNAPQIGPLLQRQRKERGLTLQQLSALSGVSKSMLSQIERGEANPTFAVLWSLTRGLGIDFVALLGEGQATAGADNAIEMLSLEHTPTIRSADSSCQLRILSPPNLSGDIEWYDVEIAPGGCLHSSPHAAGAVEHFTALSGEFVIASGTSRQLLRQGETARYPVDVAHSISNPLEKPSRGLMVLLYRKSSKGRNAF